MTWNGSPPEGLMSESARDGTSAEKDLRSRWLVFSTGERNAAISIGYMVKILERAELFQVPLMGEEFKGIIYYNELAVPVLDWEYLTGKKIAGANILILEEGNELLGIEIDEPARVEEHRSPGRMGEQGYWAEMDPGMGLWALNVANVFRALRKG